jgi:glutamate-1-semialdehyde 2,1-aminomutase
MNRTRSRTLFEKAQQLMPGGVNSPVRAFRSVGGDPVFMARGEGARLYDADGNEYLDYCCSWGPLLLGHRHPAVIEALQQALDVGTSFGASTEREVEFAERICRAVPFMERMRLVSSGTEAVMSALRAARGFTGRDLIVKFEGCYHGHVDSLLVKGGSGLATLGISDSAGVPAAFSATTIALPFNSPEAVENAFQNYAAQIAAVIVEPVAGNMGCVPPQPGFLELLRETTARHGALLIFDEVITGFRLGLGGAQGRFGIRPDLTILGKVIGAGLPIGAYGGRADIMSKIAPLGPVYQAGTLSGNPLAVSAGLAALRYLEQHPELYGQLEQRTARLCEGLAESARGAGRAVTINRLASMFTVFFTEGPVTDWTSAKPSNTAAFGRFFHGMLDRGVYWPPAQFEAAFLSAAHTDEDIAKTIRAATEAFAAG